MRRNKASSLSLSTLFCVVVLSAVHAWPAEPVETVEPVLEPGGSLAPASPGIGELLSTNVVGRLADLERKAFEYESLQAKLRAKDEAIAELHKELASAWARIAANEKEITRFASRTNELSAVVSKLRREYAELKAALDLIRIGPWEHYEVKEGDTCESIAARPTIYGDAKKHMLIRQANRGHVADLDNLVPGESLVIPRLSTGGRYEF